MRKKSILKKARYLSQAEETSCILDKYSETKKNEDNSSSETSKLDTEIKTFVEDTNNELNFYLNDRKINNATEKCQKSSSYVNWRGMDFVNLVLNEETDQNIPSLVNCWNKKQNSLETQIREKTSSTCNLKNFDYCAVLNKNDNCTSPYKDSDIPGLISLTYNQLSESEYIQNKTQIIYDRASQFDTITKDISNYYYKIYEANSNQLNCGKWSMYIFKRGRQFVNMMNYELYSEENYRSEFVDNWNTFSNNLQQSILKDTGNQCNMTKLIYQIKERKNTTDPYNLDWLPSNSTQNNSNESIYNTTVLPDALQPTTVIPNGLHNDTATDSLGSNTTSVNNVNGVNPSENTLTGHISVPPPTADQIDPKISTTISPIDTTQSNFLTPNDTIHLNTNNISNTTSSSHSPEVVTSPTTETLPSNSTTSSGTPSVTPLPEEISATTANDYSNTTMKSFTNNTATSTTITPPLTTASLSSPEDMSPTNRAIPSNNNTASLTSSSAPTVTYLPVNESPPNITASSTNITASSTTTVESLENNITLYTTPTKSPETSLSSESATSVNKIIPTNSTESPTIDSSSPEVEPSLTTITRTPTYSSTPPLLSPTPTITTLPSTNNSTSPTNDMPIHPTNDFYYFKELT
ncbi:surface-associated interspersed protein (SURFIN) [Plasmodium gallinaceum]|uniref:Surface-associated interspersed protein (SURFIN) n=1 Tax=Plasmodium gallinaceum TaxID=5849 RepID=A0A1J1GUZ6_PLAGA|nr:surface-associated interspersed protein (SURFIN) [Plasmodium gallinaceum]CRG96059.1 surface-associated interspersed protein (SURFIN) [Plasmodium gallinaceum]